MQNLFIGKGNLADSPELKHLPGGRNGTFVVAKMRVMFGRYGSNEAGEFMATDEHGNEVQVMKVVADDVALQLSRIESITFTPSKVYEPA